MAAVWHIPRQREHSVPPVDAVPSGIANYTFTWHEAWLLIVLVGETHSSSLSEMKQRFSEPSSDLSLSMAVLAFPGAWSPLFHQWAACFRDCSLRWILEWYFLPQILLAEGSHSVFSTPQTQTCDGALTHRRWDSCLLKATPRTDKQTGKAAAEIIMPLIANNKRIKGWGHVAFLRTKAKAGVKSVPPVSRVSVLAAGARKHLLFSC